MLYVRPKRRLLQEPHGITPQKTAFFIERCKARKEQGILVEEREQARNVFA
jgi:hypothetical protein